MSAYKEVWPVAWAEPVEGILGLCCLPWAKVWVCGENHKFLLFSLRYSGANFPLICFIIIIIIIIYLFSLF